MMYEEFDFELNGINMKWQDMPVLEQITYVICNPLDFVKELLK